MSRIDYSKWDKLDYSSSSSEDGKSEETAMREKAIRAMEMLLLRETSSSPLWNGLVKHHKDIFVSHVLPKLNKTDRIFFSKVNSEGKNLLKYAGINVLEMGFSVYDCSSISTLEWTWNVMRWGAKAQDGTVVDQAFFC